jgi:ribosomal protein S18 acetylase RimI-like enzyme
VIVGDGDDPLALTAALEERAFFAWPAEEVKELDGWRLRYTRGVTRRANSVWPNAGGAAVPLDRRLREVEAFYRSRGQRAQYQLSPVATPPGLDHELDQRGYVIDAPVEVQTATLAAQTLVPPAPGIRTEVTLVPTARWFEVSALRGRFAPVADVYRALLGRLGAGRAVYVLAEHRGIPAAVGLGVVDGGWMGIFAMSTLPELRRMGLASAVLRALMRAAAERGVERLYLQVEQDNQAARALYAAAGFTTAYRYHYRVGSLA